MTDEQIKKNRIYGYSGIVETLVVKTRKRNAPYCLMLIKKNGEKKAMFYFETEQMARWATDIFHQGVEVGKYGDYRNYY